MTPLLLIATAALLAGPPSPTAFPLPDGGTALKYELRVIGAVVAHAEIKIGAVKTLKNKRLARTLSVSARTRGAFKELYKFDNSFHSVLDAKTLRPLRTRLERLIDGVREVMTLAYRTRSAKVTRGKNPSETVKIRRGSMDPVSWILWLAGLDLMPGDTVKTPIFSGKYHMRLTAKAGAYETVTGPAGSSRAMRIECVMHMLPKPGETASEPPRKLDKVTLWLADDAFHTPVKVLVNFRLLGDVVMALTHRKVL